MTSPTADEQLQFLRDLQRLLDEGSFVATYKYALLMALADLSVEHGDDSGDTLPLALSDIAEKFIQYYWRQAVPYPGDGEHSILYQNKGQQAAIINAVVAAHPDYGQSMAKARRDNRAWSRLVKHVSGTIEKMPLWKLQTIGQHEHCFLYLHQIDNGHITLLPGVAFCFRRFHSLIVSMLQGAWVGEIRKIKQNQAILGQTTDLQSFLFGSERDSLSPYRSILLEQQEGRCFYCDHHIRTTGEVDHFIPWSRYPVDLGHNFVLVHGECNRHKKDHLAALPHLSRWVDRNNTAGSWLASEFEKGGLIHDQVASLQIAQWAYTQVELVDGRVWLDHDNFIALEDGWSRVSF